MGQRERHSGGGNADVVRATSRAGASHASWHLDLDGEVGGAGSGETADADARDVLGDLGVLERSWVRTGGGGVDLSSKWASTVLVDLVEGHGDGAVIGTGWETLRGTSACGLGNTLLSGALGGFLASTSTTSSTLSSLELWLTLLVGVGSWGSATGAHEAGDGLVSIDWAVLGAAERGGLASTHLAGADDGGIGLRTAAGRGTIARSAISNRKTRHGDLVGTLDLGNDTVGGDGGHEGREDV